MLLNVHRNHNQDYQVRDGETGVEGGGGETEGYYIPITTLSPPESDLTPALRWAADESHFNVSLIVRDKVTRQCPQHNF